MSNPASTLPAELFACPQCDLLQQGIPLERRGTAHCSRCRALLYRHHPLGLERALAFSLAALVCFVVANAFPLLGMEIAGDRVEVRLIDTVWAFQRDGMGLVAVLLWFATFFAPLLQILALLAILLPIHLGFRSLLPAQLVPLLDELRHWSMVEVFVLGVLVALVKLQSLAQVIPGVSLWAFFALMLSLTAALTAFDARQVWACHAKTAACGR